MPPALPADVEHLVAGLEPLRAELRGARVFVTGGTGFVGTWLLEAFVAANARLGLDARAVVLTRDPARFRARSPHLAEDSAVELLAGDAATFTPPDGAFPFVIHAATTAAYPTDRSRPLGLLGDDAAATRRVLELCAASETGRMLFTSSGAVYGRQPPTIDRIAEDDPVAPDPTDPSTAYGQSKRWSEFACVSYGAAYGFGATVARLFAFVGPHLPLDQGYAVGNFVRDALRGGPIRVAGDGTPLRSYLYAADLAIWLWHLLVRGAAGRAYNVGSPDALSIAELARQVAVTSEGDVAVEVAGVPRPGAPPARYVPCVDRAQRELGLRPLVDLSESLRRTFRWYRTQADVSDVVTVR